jgi:hypothetical protein
MPRTPLTIVTPKTRDHRVLLLAKTLSVTRAEAFLAVAEVWETLSVEADGDGIVKGWTPDMADALVDVADGFGKAMVGVELLGVVNDGLVLPAELRRAAHEERGGGGGGTRAAAADADERRKEQQRAAARKYRKRKKLTGSKPKPMAKSWRSLGKVGSHEVRVFDGPHGPYAMLLNATIGGEPARKMTTSDKSWTLESVTLAEALPGLVSKWKAYHDTELKTWDAAKRRTLVPSFEDFSAAASKAVAMSQLERGAAQAAAADAITEPAADHAAAQNDDASARHHDAPSSVIISSPPRPTDADRNAVHDNGLEGDGASSSRHDDALSSMSSKSSSLREEEMQGQGAGPDDADGQLLGPGVADGPPRRPADGHAPDGRLDASRTPTGIDGRPLQDWEKEHLRAVRDRWAGNCSRVLRVTPDEVIAMHKADREQLRKVLEAAGVDPRTGLPPVGGPQLAQLPDQRRGRSDLEAVGIPFPDLGVERAAAVALADGPGEDVDQEDRVGAVAALRAS